jgi:diguanylate cyclase
MAGNSAEQLKLEADLRRALDRNELCVYYQPQVDLSTGKITGAEALVRWLSIERGIVSPTQFIPLAEEIGLIRPIGEWVLCTACQQVQAWRQAGMAPIRIAVNLSGQQLNQPQLATIVAQVLQSSGLDAEALELELTEGTLLQNEAEAIAILNELKALGVGVAIDDFGTGYASLNYLRQFPFDVLKIDRSFIQNVHSESYNNAITTAVLQMAHHLNLKVVAEGVETEAELAFLQQHGCHAIQGFLFSHPVPAAEFQTLLLTDKSLTLHP